jgi:hypothetical protein
MSGHWFCYKCNDVVFLRALQGRWDAKTGVCPQCHQHEARWIQHDEPVTAPVLDDATAAKGFQQIREAAK